MSICDLISKPGQRNEDVLHLRIERWFIMMDERTANVLTKLHQGEGSCIRERERECL